MAYRHYVDENDRKKRAIVFLFFFLIITIAIIIGLAFMLFNLDGDDGKIGINVTTGRCEADIINTGGKSLMGDVLKFESAAEDESVVFHPGRTYRTEGFSVKNTGTISVEYRVYISEDKSVDMKEFRKAFDLWITKDPNNLDSAEKLTSFSGQLKIGQVSEVYYLVVRMKETAGNEFQDKNYTGIGITVHVVESQS